MAEPRAREHPGGQRQPEMQHQQGGHQQPEVQHQQGGAEAELCRLRAECARLAGALVVRDDPDGYRQLERPDAVGATARAWQDVQWRIGELAAQLAAAQQLLDRADLLRQRRFAGPTEPAPVGGGPADPPGPTGDAELWALLRGPCEVVLTAATGAPVEVIRLPLPEVIVRAGEHHAAILAVAEAVAAARATVLSRIDAVVERLTGLRDRAAGVGVPEVLVEGLRAEVETLRRVGERDPLGAADGVAWAAGRDRLVGRVTDLGVRVGQAEELRGRWPGLVDELRLLIGRLDADETETRHAWRGLTPIPGDPEPVSGVPVPQAATLRIRLRAVERRCRRGEWWDAVDEGPEPAEIGAAITTAAELAARARDAAGMHRRRLYDFRLELRGRLDAFQRKAFSAGRSEDLALTDLYNEARRRLRSDPFDAPAADRAVTRYLHAVNEGGPA
ncbi:hypothetical protein OG792_30185 [Micromonospora sp. NBC_01699]|uniref:hypothetical protein n=1 Tax=Micromonospora sp. NBC_01699 TaxID=2975984 RepID=UPI002E285FFF|nr:hypothetical protein [Micromonospora sp. NBC_01699]